MQAYFIRVQAAVACQLPVLALQIQEATLFGAIEAGLVALVMHAACMLCSPHVLAHHVLRDA